MSFGILLATCFPFVHGVSFLSALFYGIHIGSPLWIIASFLHLYLTPPLLYRLHHLIWPITMGETEFSFSRYSPWYTSYQLQILFIAVRFLESALRLVPGLYSAWLRLWGAKIGKGVYWTPLVEIIDRPFLHVGNYVVVGHRATFTCHMINTKRGESGLKLYVRPIHLEEHAFIGAGARLGPGVRILARTLIKYNSECFPDKVYGGDA